MSANERQVGGSHYKAGNGQQQHWDVEAALNGYCWFRGCASKYIVRFGKKDVGTQGLEKSIHYLEKALEVLSKRGAGEFFWAHIGVAAAERAELAQTLIDNYEVANPHLFEALRVIYGAEGEADLVQAIEYIRRAIDHATLGKEVERQQHDATFTPPPISGYKVLRGDQINLINDIKAAGSRLGTLFEQVIDMYTAEDTEAENAAKAIQAEFNERVQAVFAEYPGEGEEVLEQRKAAIAKIEPEFRERLNSFNDGAKSRQDGARWLSIARTHVQQGVMAGCRAVARPEGF